MKLFLLLASMLVLLSCQESAPPYAVGDARLRTTAPSHLYFKNVRSSNYQLRQHGQPPLDHYRPRNAPDSALRPALVPVIVDNWLADEAYLRLYVLPYPGGYAQPLTLLLATDTLRLLDTLPVGTAVFARQLAQHLDTSTRVQVLNRGAEWIPLFEQEYGLDWLRTTLRDYNNLVEMDRQRSGELEVK